MAKNISKDDLKKNLKNVGNKSQGFINDFKAFIMRGNVMDMAIGVIIGTAFGGLVTALTTDFIQPLINGIGGAEVAGKIKIYGNQYINYGDFITQVINFLIMALVLFIMLRVFNNIMNIGKKKEEEKPAEVQKPEYIALLEEIRDELKK